MRKTRMERAIAEVWALFKENSVMLAESRRQSQEMLAESRRQSQESERRLERLIEESFKKSESTDRKLEKLIGKWGIFVENIIAPGIPRVFQERGIPIYQTSNRNKAKQGNKQMEIDIVGVNSEYVVAVSVKSTLGVDDVDKHLEDLADFKTYFPQYAGKKVLGAVAGISIVGNADRYAYQNGLFVIGQSGDMAVCLNDEKFKPKEW